MKNVLTCFHVPLHLVLLLILSGYAAIPALSNASPLTPAAGSGAVTIASAEALPVVAVEAANGSAEASPPLVETDPCQMERELNTVDACTGFLRSCPSVLQRQDILAQTCRLIEKQKGGYEDYKKFVLEFEDGLPFVPYRQRLLLTGPEGLRVHDCLESIKNGTETEFVLEKVRKRKGIYRDFTDEEIDTLKQLGLTSEIIQAMLESTHDAKRAEKAQKKNSYGGAYPAGGQAAQVRREGRYVSEEQPPAQAPAPAGQGPSVGEALANCAAQTVALEACSHLSGLARSLCNSTVKVQFPCQ